MVRNQKRDQELAGKGQRAKQHLAVVMLCPLCMSCPGVPSRLMSEAGKVTCELDVEEGREEMVNGMKKT